MNYFFISMGTLFTMALVVQMLAYASSTKKAKAELKKSLKIKH